MTYWEFTKPKSADINSSEWIMVDLEELHVVNQVTLKWGKFFAPSYALLVSEDGDNWTTISTVEFVDGLPEDKQFDGRPARFVKLMTTAGRSQLLEIEVFGDGSISLPTSTATPTAAGDESRSLHVGDLDSSADRQKGSWITSVDILIHDSAHVPVEGAVIRGTWSGGFSATVLCTTDSNGICRVTTAAIANKEKTAVFTVDGVEHWLQLPYKAGDNHDPDNDSNGRSISIKRP